MKIKLITILFLSLITAACGNDKNDRLLGYWELKNEGMHYHPAAIQILKDGSTYLYKDAINMKNLNYQVALKQENGNLILDSQYIPSEALSLIENETILLIGSRRFNRIEQSEIEPIRQRLLEENQRKRQELRDLIDSVN